MKLINKLFKTVFAIVISFSVMTISNTYAQTSDSTEFTIRYRDQDAAADVFLTIKGSTLKVSSDGGNANLVNKEYIDIESKGYVVDFNKGQKLYAIYVEGVEGGYFSKTVFFSLDENTFNSPSEHMSVDYENRIITIILEKNSGSNNLYSVYYVADGKSIDKNPYSPSKTIRHTIINNDYNKTFILSKANLSRIYGEAYKYFTLEPSRTEFEADGQEKKLTLYYKSEIPVTFKGADNQVISTQNVMYGKGASEPTVPNVEGKTFAGWDKDFTTITSELVVKAQYTDQTFKVEFKDVNGNVIGTETVIYGKDATAPTVPNVEGKTFAGWDKSFTNVKENLVVTAQYTTNETPIAPIVPEQPTTPDTPVIPEQPTTPDTPVVPEQPATPDTPVVPEQPTTPDTPVAPEQPTTPDTPAVPEQPATEVTYNQVTTLERPSNRYAVNQETPDVEETVTEDKTDKTDKTSDNQAKKSTKRDNENMGDGTTPLANARSHDGNCFIHIIMLILTILYSIYIGVRVFVRRKEEQEDEEDEYEAHASMK